MFDNVLLDIGAIPQGIPQPDKNSPINAGLAGLYLPGQAGGLDLSGHGAFGVFSISSPTIAPSSFGLAAQFNGSNQYITLPKFDFTNAAVFVRFKTSGGGVLFCNSTSVPPLAPSTYNPIIYVGSDGKLRGGIYNGSGVPVNMFASSATVTDGKEHVACWMQQNAASGTQSMYLDGVLIGSVTGGSGVAATYTYIGAGQTVNWSSGNGTWYYFPGIIRSVRIFINCPKIPQSEIIALASDDNAGLIFPQDYAAPMLVLPQSGGGGVNVNLSAATSSAGFEPFGIQEQYALGSAASAAAEGSLVPSLALALASGTASGAVAAFLASLAKALSASTISGAAAGLTPNIGGILSGVIGSGATAGMIPSIDGTLSGASGSGSGAGFTPSIAKSLSSAAATATAEDFTVLVGIFVNLIAASTTGGAIAFTPAIDKALIAATASAAAGNFSISFALLIALAAAEATAAASPFNKSISITLGDITTSGGFSSLNPTVAVNLSHIAAVGQTSALAVELFVQLVNAAASGAAETLAATQGVINISLEAVQAIATALGFTVVTSPEPTARFVLSLRRIIYDLNAPATSYNLVAQGLYGMPFFGNFPPVAPLQKQTLSMDFGKFLPSGVHLIGTPELTLSVRFGTDLAPNSHVTSGPTIGTVPTNLNGTGVTDAAIIFQVLGLIAGAQYTVEVVCNRSDGDIVEGSAGLPCNGPGMMN